MRDHASCWLSVFISRTLNTVHESQWHCKNLELQSVGTTSQVASSDERCESEDEADDADYVAEAIGVSEAVMTTGLSLDGFHPCGA